MSKKKWNPISLATFDPTPDQSFSNAPTFQPGDGNKVINQSFSNAPTFQPGDGNKVIGSRPRLPSNLQYGASGADYIPTLSQQKEIVGDPVPSPLPTALPMTISTINGRPKSFIQTTQIPVVSDGLAQIDTVDDDGPDPDPDVLPPGVPDKRRLAQRSVPLSRVINEPFAGVQINAPTEPQQSAINKLPALMKEIPQPIVQDTTPSFNLPVPRNSVLNFSVPAPAVGQQVQQKWSDAGYLGNIPITDESIKTKTSGGIAAKLLTASSRAINTKDSLKYITPVELEILPVACNCKKRIHELHIRKLIIEENDKAKAEGRAANMQNVYNKLGINKLCCRTLLTGSTALTSLRKKIGFDKTTTEFVDDDSYVEAVLPEETGVPATAIIDTQLNKFSSFKDPQSLISVGDLYAGQEDVFDEQIEDIDDMAYDMDAGVL